MTIKLKDDIKYSDEGLQEWQGAVCRSHFGWPFSFIQVRPKYLEIGDIGIVEHEKLHATQHRRTFTLHPLLYAFSSLYRLNSEVEAYREQVSYYPLGSDISWVVDSIHSKYNLPYSREQIQSQYEKNILPYLGSKL